MQSFLVIVLLRTFYDNFEVCACFLIPSVIVFKGLDMITPTKF